MKKKKKTCIAAEISSDKRRVRSNPFLAPAKRFRMLSAGYERKI